MLARAQSNLTTVGGVKIAEMLQVKDSAKRKAPEKAQPSYETNLQKWTADITADSPYWTFPTPFIGLLCRHQSSSASTCLAISSYATTSRWWPYCSRSSINFAPNFERCSVTHAVNQHILSQSSIFIHEKFLSLSLSHHNDLTMSLGEGRRMILTFWRSFYFLKTFSSSKIGLFGSS